MKPKNLFFNKNRDREFGFTLMELMVVLSIMVVMATLVVVDFNRQRSTRNLTLAKNETITYLREVQNNMLSSKNISDGVPARFYIAQFDMSGGTGRVDSFTVNAVDKNYTLHSNLKTIKLPGDLQYQSFRIDATDGSGPVSYPCLQIIFSAPFGKMYVNGSSSCSNNIEQTLKDPVALAALPQRRASLYIGDGSKDDVVFINPVTGQIYVD